MRRGSRNNVSSMNPTNRWKDRFHRKLQFSSDYSIYVTRPTFELLRRGDEKGQHAFQEIKSCLQSLYDKEHEEYSNLDWNGISINNNFSIAYYIPDQGQIKSVFFSGPYNVESEMSKCKSAILIHASLDISPTDCNTFNLQKFSVEPNYVLDGENNIEYQKSLNAILPEEDFNSLEHIAWDLSAARLLPTDFMLKENDANFRRVLLQQFNEIRLIDDVTKVNFEQVLTINRFNVEDSPMMNISGRPGTGKSTIQHILVCESLLQPGMKRGKRKILYLATTQTLLDEAKEEIKSILELVYNRTPKQAISDIDNIDFVTEEGLYLLPPGKSGKINDNNIRDALQEIKAGFKGRNRKDSKWDYWFENPDLLTRILNNFIYGVFGSPKVFCEWLPDKASDVEMQDLFDEAINLYKPFEKSVADIRPIYFWNPFASTTKSKACERIRSLKSLLISEGGLTDYLINSEWGYTDGLWNTSGLLYSLVSNIEVFDRFKGLSKVWDTALNTGYDCIFIDESQDFTTFMLSVLLEYFSNRGNGKGANRPPFVLITAGDEYQTIRGGLFQGKMLHINNLYQDWKESLIKQSKDANWTLADGLNNPQKKDLRANYRNFDTAVEVVNHIVTKMSDIGQKAMPNMKRAIKLNRADVERKGYLTSSPNSEDRRNKQSEENWELVISQLEKQITDYTGNEETVVKVALILPCQTINSKETVVDHLISIKNWPNKEITKSVSNIIQNIENFYSEKAGSDLAEWKTILDEVGIFDIESIKGLTVPVVITFFEEKDNEEEPWIEMQDLSYILVAVSRPQFGLFVVTETFEEYQKITQQQEFFKNTIPEDKLDSNEGFRQFLENSTIPQIPMSKLFLQALDTAYSARKWRRLQNDINNLASDLYEFIESLRNVFMTIRRPIESQVYSTINENFDEIFNCIRDTELRSKIELYLNGNFITEQNSRGDSIRTLKLFVNLNILSRITYYEIEDEGLFDKIINDTRKLWSDWNNVSPELVNKEYTRVVLSSSPQTFLWLKLLFGRIDEEEMAESVELISNQMNIPSPKLDSSKNSEKQRLTHISYPTGWNLPRIKVSPWHFPMPIDAENTEPWMVEDSYWTLSADLLIEIIESYDRDDSLDLSSNFLENTISQIKWIVRIIQRDAEKLVNWVIDNPSEDNSIINWLMSLLIPDESRVSESKIVKELLKVIPKRIEESEIFASKIQSWLLELDNITDIETAFDLILRLDPTFDTEIIDCIDIVPVIKQWQKSYLQNQEQLRTIPDSISKVLSHIYPEAQPARVVDELNRIIKLDKNADEDVTFVRGFIQSVDRDGRKRIEMFSNNNSNENAVDWEDNFSSGRVLLDRVLEHALDRERIIAYNNQFYLTKDKKNLEDSQVVSEEDLESTLEVTEWLLDNLPQKSQVKANLIQLCKSINQDALSKITNAIAFDGASTDLIFQSLNSRRAQIGHFKKQWYTKDPSTWDWRNSGHNFWNTDLKYVHPFKAKRVVNRFPANNQYDPQLCSNDEALIGYIKTHKLLKDEQYDACDFEDVSTHFLRAGAIDRAIESIILDFAFKNKKSPNLRELIKTFANSLLSYPAVYTSHLNNVDTSVDRGMPVVLPRWGDGEKEPSEFIPELLVDDALNTQISISKLVRDKEHLVRINEELDDAKYRRIKQTIEIEPKSDGIWYADGLKAILERDLVKYFTKMKFSHELMKLAKILKMESKNVSSAAECLELLNKIKSSKVKIKTYTQERKPFSSDEDSSILLYVDTNDYYRMLLHTEEIEIGYSAKRFSSYFTLLEKLITATVDTNEKAFVDRVQKILKEHFGSRSLVSVTIGNKSPAKNTEAENNTNPDEELNEKFKDFIKLLGDKQQSKVIDSFLTLLSKDIKSMKFTKETSAKYIKHMQKFWEEE